MSLKADDLNSLKCYITQSQVIFYMLDIILKRFVIYLEMSKFGPNDLISVDGLIGLSNILTFSFFRSPIRSGMTGSGQVGDDGVRAGRG